MTTTKPAAKDPLRVVLGTCRVSYVHIKEPTAFEDDGDKKYDITFLIPKDSDDVAKVEAAIKAAYDSNKESMFKGVPLTSPKMWNPLRDGDDYADEKEAEGQNADAYRGCYFLKASSKSQPKVFYSDKQEMIDLDELYSGCYCRGAIKCNPFNNKAKGFSFYVNSVMKMDDGEPLGGFAASADDYDDDDLV